MAKFSMTVTRAMEDALDNEREQRKLRARARRRYGPSSASISGRREGDRPVCASS